MASSSIAVAGSSSPIRTLRQWMMPAPQSGYSRGPLSTVSHWVIVAEHRDTQLKQHSYPGPYLEGFQKRGAVPHPEEEVEKHRANRARFIGLCRVWPF